MSKTRKQESKKDRLRRIKRNHDSFYSLVRKKEDKKNEIKFPESFEEAVKMGILR
jgi:hypothetical protein